MAVLQALVQAVAALLRNNMTQSKTALILFVRNPVLGKVKTRLAKTVGDEKALKIYRLLLSHTHHLASAINCSRFVFYADFINDADLWESDKFHKCLQTGGSLGDRMLNAFADIFNEGFEKVLIIGSDCYQLTTTILEEATKQLDTADVVIGPAYDGGYYLLGMNRLVPEVFQHKNWSTETVFKETLHDLECLNLSYSLLPTLDDVDTEADLIKNNINID